MTYLDQQNTFREWFQNFRPSNRQFQIALGTKCHRESRVSSFLLKRKEFKREGKPIGVEIGYHYTRSKNVDGISEQGLQADKCSRAFFGQGIYVATNPFGFSLYGDVGYLCLILTGVQKGMYDFDHGECDDEEWPDSFRGNKVKSSLEDRTTYFDEIVLTSSDQVLPLIRYPVESIDNAKYMQQMHTAVHQWVTKHFPGGFASSPIFVTPNEQDLQYAGRLQSVPNFGRQTVVLRQAPSITTNGSFRQQPMFSFGQSSVRNPPKCLQCCSVCRHPVQLHEPALVIQKCHHSFHHACLHPKMLQSTQKCPLCTGIVCVSSLPTQSGVLYAKPSTKMSFPGNPSNPVLELLYSVSDGRDFQGKPNASKVACAVYLPDIPESRELLKRLLFSFRGGSSFTLRTGLQTFIEGTIPHITQLAGKPEVWTHPQYFPHIHTFLTNLGVPVSAALPPLHNGWA